MQNGATPPFLVHSMQSSKANDIKPAAYKPDSLINLNEHFSEGLANPMAGPRDFTKRKNPCGFCVRATKNGSMTLDIIYDYACHFVKHLPEGQGKGGSAHILFLDRHASLKLGRNRVLDGKPSFSIFPPIPYLHLDTAQ